MSKIESFRKVLALPEIKESVDLTDKLKEIYTDYLELLDKNNDLNSRLKEMVDVSNIKKTAKVHSGYYTLDGVKDVDGNEIPFCLNCLYEYGLQIPMMYGIVQTGTVDILSGETMIPSVFGLTCKKCNTKLAMTVNEKK